MAITFLTWTLGISHRLHLNAKNILNDLNLSVINNKFGCLSEYCKSEMYLDGFGCMK